MEWVVDREKNNSFKGYLCVILAALMWASSGTAGKALFDGGMSPFDLVQIRVTIASAVIFSVILLLSRDLLRIRPKDIPFFLLLGGVAMALVTGSYLYTISKIQVAAAILIQYLAPIFVAIYSMLFWKERPTVFKITALFLAFGGCFLVVGGYSLELLNMNLLGILGGLTSAITFAGYSLLGERAMHRYRPWSVIFYALAFSALTWHVVYPPSPISRQDTALSNGDGFATSPLSGPSCLSAFFLLGLITSVPPAQASRRRWSPSLPGSWPSPF